MQNRDYPGRVPKKDRTWLRRAVSLSLRNMEDMGHKGLHSQGGRRPTRNKGVIPDRFLMRSRGQQGAPFKCPVIREYLWDWFVDIRGSLATTITPKFVLSKARQIAELVLAEQRKNRDFTELPHLDKHWLLRWKRDYGVVFRRPNLRFKCSKPMLLARLRAMWRNVLAVRFLALRFLGKDLSNSFWGVDEKPIHFNQAGSKNARTLEIVGTIDVPLKQNHAATRERVSIMTCVSTRESAKLPLELLFRGKTDYRIRALKVSEDHPVDRKPVTFQTAVKGSYRQEHLLIYLGRLLDPWTPERAASVDYRVLMLDVARSHTDVAVTDFAWQRGYVVLYHYGHTTGVAQVNDTDLHAAFEREYLEVEQRFFNEQQLRFPGDINRSPQDVVDDACETWRILDHGCARLGHWRVGLANALDGSEDHRLRRVAAECWHDLAMWEVRNEVRAEVDAAIASGSVASFEDWRTLVRTPVDPGVLFGEGSELEAALVDGDVPWEDAEGEKVIERDDADVARIDTPLEGESSASVVPHRQGDILVQSLDDLGAMVDAPPDVVAQAKKEAERLQKLRQLRADACHVNMPVVRNQADRLILQHERGLRAKTDKDHQSNMLLRRRLDQEREEERRKADAYRQAQWGKREEERKHKLMKQRVACRLKERRSKALAQKRAAQQAKAEWKHDMESLPQRVDGNTLSCGKDGFKNRKAFLERVKVLSPELPRALQLRWLSIRNMYADLFPKWFMKQRGQPAPYVGPAFYAEVNEVITQLGPHFKGVVTHRLGSQPSAPSGDLHAFESYVRRMSAREPWAHMSMEI